MAELVTELSAADAAAITNLLDAAAQQQLLCDREAAEAAHPPPSSSVETHPLAEEPSEGVEGTTQRDGIRTKDQVRADIVRDVLLFGLTDLEHGVGSGAAAFDRAASGEPGADTAVGAPAVGAPAVGGPSVATMSRPTISRAIIPRATIPRATNPRPTINVHVGLGTLVGTDGQAGWLDGYGPITAETARELAADRTGTWRRIIVDEATGRLLAFDDKTYRPPDAFDRYIRRARIRCTFPGCGRPAQRCDLDHATSHACGGRTNEWNLHPLCRRHHMAKHLATGPWTPYLDDSGVTWMSPLGRRYRVDQLVRLSESPRREGPTSPKDEGTEADLMATGASRADPDVPPF